MAATELRPGVRLGLHEEAQRPPTASHHLRVYALGEGGWGGGGKTRRTRMRLRMKTMLETRPEKQAKNT